MLVFICNFKRRWRNVHKNMQINAYVLKYILQIKYKHSMYLNFIFSHVDRCYNCDYFSLKQR